MAPISRNGLPVIEDDLRDVGGEPGSLNTGQQPTGGVDVALVADALRAYVAGGGYSWFHNMPKALPWALDDISRDFGDDIYERMLLDPQIRSNVNVVKAGVLETGIACSPAVDKEGEDGYEESTQLVDRVEAMFDQLNPALDDTLWDMLDAVPLGSRVGELLFALDATVTGKREYVLQGIEPRPRHSVAFVVDVYMHLLGILGRVPGEPFSVQQGILLPDLAKVPNLLPVSKFAVLTFRPKNNDPRGQPVLRPCFDPWNRKVQLKRDYLKYLTQFASPSLIGTTPPEAESTVLTNPDGTAQLDSNGYPVVKSPEDNMLAALVAFMNSSVTALPGGSEVKPLEMSGAGEAFINAFTQSDHEITKAVLGQVLATEEGQHQTRAATGTHKDVMDTLIRQCKRPVERMMRHVLRTWMTLNGEQNLLPLMPKITLGEVAQEDLWRLWSAVASLQTSGYLDRSQLIALDSRIDLPVRDITSVEPPAPPPTAPPAPPKGIVPPQLQGQQGQPPPNEPPPGQPDPPRQAGFSDPTPDEEIEQGQQQMREEMDTILDWLERRHGQG